MFKRQLLHRAALLVLLPVLLLAACSEADWIKAAKAVDGFSDALVAAQATEIAAYHSGFVTPSEHLQIQLGFGKVATSGLALTKALKVSHDAKTAQVELQATFDALDELVKDGIIPIKNENVKAGMLVAISTAKSFLATISALGGHYGQ